MGQQMGNQMSGGQMTQGGMGNQMGQGMSNQMGGQMPGQMSQVIQVLRGSKFYKHKN